MRKIIALIGKTASGKDSAARFIKGVCGIPQIVSYATRPIREGEVNGREHYFVSDVEMDDIVREENELLAFVRFPKTGYRYCASTKDYNFSESQ